MDEPPDDTISLRACATELRPEEAIAYAAANEALNGFVAAFASDLDLQAEPDVWHLVDRTQEKWSLEEALVRSSLLSMATAIVGAATAGRAIWRGGIKLPVFPPSLTVCGRQLPSRI
jgi:hypothetical protein